ncbi:MAG: esterase/lipase family protein [Janthinobacterium lividum]
MSIRRISRDLLLLLAIVLIAAVHSFAQATVASGQPASTLRPRVIVFVHGLHGDHESWRAANGAYWPDLVRSDPRFAYSDVDVAEYPSPASNGKMSSVQLAETLWNRLRQDHVWDHREVVFVAHSLGGILVEEMLLRHPAEAPRVKFIVSYGTPHEGSTVARIAALYDKDPLLNDLSDASSNAFLTQLEDSWRGHASVNSIHRFCAYETEDTKPQDGIARYLRTHTRVVSYFSATYGCDVTTPPQEIHEDHIHMIKPLNRTSPAYDFFRRVYRDNPVLNEQVVVRENIIGGLSAGCNQTNENPDLQVPVALDGSLHEKVLSATASLIDTSDVREINPDPPVVTSIEPYGLAHVHYGFKGPGRKLLVCTGTAHASLKVQFSIDQQLPMREPQK